MGAEWWWWRWWWRWQGWQPSPPPPLHTGAPLSPPLQVAASQGPPEIIMSHYSKRLTSLKGHMFQASLNPIKLDDQICSHKKIKDHSSPPPPNPPSTCLILWKNMVSLHLLCQHRLWTKLTSQVLKESKSGEIIFSDKEKAFSVCLPPIGALYVTMSQWRPTHLPFLALGKSLEWRQSPLILKVYEI